MDKMQRAPSCFDVVARLELTADIGNQSGPVADRWHALLAGVGTALAGPLDERLRLERLSHCLIPHLGEWCLISLLDADERLMPVALAAATTERAAELRLVQQQYSHFWNTQSPLGCALCAQEPVVIERTLHTWAPEPTTPTSNEAVLEAFDCNAMLIAPIIFEGRAAGVIVTGTVLPHSYSTYTRAWMAEVGRRAGTAIENARLYARERTARAAAEAAIGARDKLTALIAHDLRNPLAVIHGQSELLLRHLQQDKPDDARIARGLDAVRGAATQMRLLLDDLQEVTYFQSEGPLSLRREPTDLVILAQRAVALQQATMHGYNIEITAVLPALWCLCDPRQLDRVLMNLLSNATKFSPAGTTVTLEVSRTVDSQGSWAALSVSDQGAGIPADELPHIFEPFHRAHNVRHTTSGTGLGLASAHAIIVQHGGTITVKSVEGVGSTFTVKLPLGECEPTYRYMP